MIEKIKKQLLDDGLSDKSINLYINNLIKLNDGEPFKNLNFLKDKEQIDKFLTKYSSNTKKNFIASIVRILKLYKNKHEDLYNYYNELLNKFMKETNENKNNKNDKENKNWLDFEKVIEIKEELKTQYESLIGKKKLKEKEFNIMLKYVILSLYTLIPPRRNLDYMEMVVNMNNKDLDKEFNHFIIKDKLFIFNKYKTSKSYSNQEIKVPDELFEILMNYLKFHPDKETKSNKPLLVDYKNNRLNKINSITRILNSIFGKKVGSSMLRKIFISHKFGDDLEKIKEMQETAQAMGHSIGTAQTTYNKGN